MKELHDTFSFKIFDVDIARFLVRPWRALLVRKVNIIWIVWTWMISSKMPWFRSRFNPGMYDEEIEGEEEVEEQKPPEYEFIVESDTNMLSSMYPDICDSGTWYNPEYPPPTINTGLSVFHAKVIWRLNLIFDFQRKKCRKFKFMSHQSIQNHQVLKNLQVCSKPMKTASPFWTWLEADLAGWDLRACLDHKWPGSTQEPIWGKLSNLLKIVI